MRSDANVSKIRWATASLSLAIGMTLGLFMIFVLGILAVSIADGNSGSGLIIAAVLSVVLAPFVTLAYSIRCGLVKRRRWAWIGGIILFTAQLPTAWFPFGVAGLWGLLHPTTRAWFRSDSNEMKNPSTDEYVAILSAIFSLLVILSLFSWVGWRMNARKSMSRAMRSPWVIEACSLSWH